MAAESRPEYVVLDVSIARANQENRAEVAVLSNGRRFNIDFQQADLREPGQSRPSKFELEYLAVLPELDEISMQDSDREQSPGNQGTPFKQKASNAKVDSEEFDQHLRPCDGECPEDLFEAWIVRPFIRHRTFQKFAPPSSQPLLSTLRDRLYPPTLTFTLRVEHGELVPKRISNSQEMIDFYARPADISTSFYWSECPSVKPEHVSLAQRSHPQNPNLVMFQGKKCWFKAVHDTVPDEVFAREIDTLLRVQKIGLSNQIRVPKLNGLVMSLKAGHIHGLLLDAVNNHGSVWDRHKDPIALRKRWYNDVARMIAQLHEADIIWGDFKPANMLVDEKDDVWLIDFGGGMTEGWLDEKNKETKKGDLQGLAEFRKFLRLENVKGKDRSSSKTGKQSLDQARHKSPDPRRQPSPDKVRKQSPDQARHQSPDPRRHQRPDLRRHQNPDPRQQTPDKARKQSADQTRAHSAEKTRK